MTNSSLAQSLRTMVVLSFDIVSSGVSRVGLRGGGSKSRKSKWLVKVDASIGVNPTD